MREDEGERPDALVSPGSPERDGPSHLSHDHATAAHEGARPSDRARQALTMFPADHPDVRNDIAHLGAVADGQTIGLVDDRAAIVMLCWPLLDSPSVFADLLREARGGRAREALYLDADDPVLPVRQGYVDGTDVLETVVRVGAAELTVTDIPARPPLAKGWFRRLRAGDRPVRVATIARPGFDYGRVPHERCSAEVTEVGNAVVISPDCSVDTATGESVDLALVSPDPVETVGPVLVVTHDLPANGETWLALTQRHAVHEATPDAMARAEARLRSDSERLAADCSYRGRHRTAVLRSAAALLMLEHHRERAGGDPRVPLAAAGTFSLPEAHGGERNYDYRFMWARDTGLAVDAMCRVGLAERARPWLEFAIARNGPSRREPIALMRTLDACDVPGDESEPDGFTGLYGAEPVRVGNAAAGQLQLDIFGALMMGAHSLHRAGHPASRETLDRLAESLDWLVDNWNTKDASIWEMRTGEEHFIHSRVMSWVAFDRALDMGLSDDTARTGPWADARAAIRADVEAHFWCPATQSYMQTPSFAYVDAATIFMRACGFLQRDDVRWLGTKKAVRERLMTVTGLLRYPRDVEDGFSTEDNPFVLCTSWWIEALVMDGEREEAELLLAMLIDRMGPCGLMSEEIDEQGRLMGNIPQAFSHAGILNAAVALG